MDRMNLIYDVGEHDAPGTNERKDRPEPHLGQIT